MNRDRAYYRKMAFKKARRKRNLDIALDPFGKPRFDNLHQYSKEKIHCSCPMCSAKTRNKGRRSRKNYNPSVYYTIKDMKRIMAMDWEEE